MKNSGFFMFLWILPVDKRRRFNVVPTLKRRRVSMGIEGDQWHVMY